MDEPMPHSPLWHQPPSLEWWEAMRDFVEPDIYEANRRMWQDID